MVRKFSGNIIGNKQRKPVWNKWLPG